MKKILLTESEKDKLISEREKLIIQNFAKTFNKIKRIDESEVDEKVIEEGLKTNLAAAALAAAGAHGAHAQSNHSSLPNAHGKEIQASPNQQSIAGAANPYGAEDKSNLYAHTKPIVDIQFGVQDGKTGNPSVYVYHKDRNAPGFNPATDRTTVFTKNLDLLQNTREYQDYIKRLHALGKRGGYAPIENNPVDESDINELDLDTYAKQMDRTESFPMTHFLSSPEERKNPKGLANKKQRVNRLSRERFEPEFYKIYPKETTKINTNLGTLPFKGLKFNTNYANYSLMFERPSNIGGSLLFISYNPNEPSNYYIDKEGVEITDEESKKLVNDMLKYNLGARTTERNKNNTPEPEVAPEPEKSQGLLGKVKNKLGF